MKHHDGGCAGIAPPNPSGHVQMGPLRKYGLERMFVARLVNAAVN